MVEGDECRSFFDPTLHAGRRWFVADTKEIKRSSHRLKKCDVLTKCTLWHGRPSRSFELCTMNSRTNLMKRVPSLVTMSLAVHPVAVQRADDEATVFGTAVRICTQLREHIECCEKATCAELSSVRLSVRS